MNNKHLKTISLILALLITLSFLSACGGTDEPSSAPEDVSEVSDKPETSGELPDNSETEPVGAGITVTINGTPLAVKAVDPASAISGIALYDREYKNESDFAYYVSGNPNTFVSVKLSYRYGDAEYSLISSHSDPEQTLIPVNGFVLSVPDSAMPEGLKITSGCKITVEGWDPPAFERTDLCTVVPENRSNTRRVYMRAPENSEYAEDKIYLVGSGVTVPAGAVGVELGKSNAGYQKIVRLVEPGETIASDDALVFTGEYNAGYAKKFFADGEVRFSYAEKLNAVCDSPAVRFGESGDYIVIPQQNVNAESAEDGVYLYDMGGNTAVTRANGFFFNVVVRSGKVAYISEEGENVIIPSSDGYVVTFAGQSKGLCEGIEPGEKVSDILMESYSLPAMFARIKSNVIEIAAVNIPVSDSYPCVLYNSGYGESTGTENCAEVVISDGKVLSVTKQGNSTIPADGYVISVKKGSPNYATAANRASAGDSALVSLGGNMYSYSTFRYNNTNVVRQADFIVIYNDSFGSSTRTNEYGYEFAVDKNGSICDSSYAGNMDIPKGGFVVSAHGANISTLEKVYSYGATVELDKTNRTVTVKSTPESVFYDAEYRYLELKEAYDNALKQLLCIDYASIGAQIEKLDNFYKDVNANREANRMINVVEGSQTLRSSCENLRFAIYESAPVENRAVWYRCNEKSDEQVTATCELMRQMNVNAVYLETWYDGRFIGYSDNPLIEHCSLNGDYDVLEGFCRIGHQYGIEIHCWVENFFIGSSSKLVDATKEYHLLDDKGKDYQPTMYGPFVFLDPLDERSRKLVLDLYREILTKYDVDGLNLDYIRFPGNAEDGGDFGYNEDIIAAFKESTGVTTDPHKLTKGTADWLKWSRFKESIINEWVEVVYNMVREVKPGTSISCAVGSDYPNSRTDINQNFADWVDKGFIDEVFSMSYFSNLESAEKAMKTFTKYTKGKCFYTIGLSAFESSPDYILVGQVDMGIKRGNGSNLFSWGSLIKHEENYFDALKESIWSRPAARCDSGSKAVYAYCTRLIEDSKSVYIKQKADQASVLESLCAKAKAIAEDASEVDFDSLQGEARKAYLKTASDQMNELKSLAETITDDQLKTKIVDQIQFIIDCLAVTR